MVLTKNQKTKWAACALMASMTLLNAQDGSGAQPSSNAVTYPLNIPQTESEPVVTNVVEEAVAEEPADTGMTVVEPEMAEVEATEVAPMSEPAPVEEVSEIPALQMDMSDGAATVVNMPEGSTTDVAVTVAEEETIKVDFENEEARTIIRNVADLYELNVVIPDALVGRTSIKLRNVTWRQVFDVVLGGLGYTYKEDGNIIKIITREEADLEPVDTRVFPVNYAVAGTLQGSIAPLIDAARGGRIQVDARTNMLIITERPSKMNQIQEIIERLDQPVKQVLIESKFVEVTDRNQKDLGVNWSSLSGYEVAMTDLERQWSKISGTGQTRTDSAVFSADSFNLILSALQTNTDTRLVSNPTVVTLDGEKALISIGDRYPIPNYTYNEEQGSFEVSGFEFEDIGINLEVLPQVNSDGFIRLDIRPEISSQNGEVNFGGASGATIPIIASRRTESQVILKDNYTLAIGGLIENTVDDSNAKVPVLGKIPYLGRLFQSESRDRTDRNLIIFVTARTLSEDGTTYREIIDPRMIHDMGLTESDIPGYQVSAEEMRNMQALENERQEAKLKAQLSEMQQQLQAFELQKQMAAQAAAEAAAKAAAAEAKKAAAEAKKAQ